MEIAAICFWRIELLSYAKNFYVFCLYLSKLLKIKKTFDRQSLVNVTLKIRTKFHSNRLVRFRDILHTVSENLVSRETRFKFQNVVFHVSPLLFSLIYRGSQFLQFTTKLNPNPLIFDSPNVIFKSHDLHFTILLKVVNSDTNSITLYPRIYYYAPR